MNGNPIVMEALSDLGVPVRWLEYKGGAPEYIVFNDALNAPSLYADDCDALDTVIIQVHHYTRDDPNNGRVKQIRRRLRAAGFTILETLTTRDYGSGKDTGYLHTVVRAQIEGVSEDFKED